MGFWCVLQLQVGVELEVMGFWGALWRALWGFGVHYGVFGVPYSCRWGWSWR